MTSGTMKTKILFCSRPGVSAEDALDTVITNAIVIDYTGIFKCDIGIKNGIITGLGAISDSFSAFSPVGSVAV